MNRRQIALKMVMGELKIVPPANIDDLLKLQWSIYLTQTILTTLGYSYEWSPKGPLSYDLQNDSLTIAKSDLAGGWALDAYTKQKLQEARKFLDQVTDNPEQLQRFASVLFVKNTGQGTTPEEIVKCLAVAGHNLNLDCVREVLEIADGHISRMDRRTG